MAIIMCFLRSNPRWCGFCEAGRCQCVIFKYLGPCREPAGGGKLRRGSDPRAATATWSSLPQTLGEAPGARRSSGRDREDMDSARPRRHPIKFQRPDWKAELRTNCLRRIRNDRNNLLSKLRAQEPLPTNDMKKDQSEVRNIITDELEKLKHSVDGKEDMEMDVIWEYGEPQVAWPAETDNDDVLLEMERLLYEDLREESMRKELEALEEEDAYLAQAVFEHMQLNDTEASGSAKVWCPVCKQGELRDTYNLIYCTSCMLRLDLGEDKITLEFLRERLANAHEEHFDRGCKASPKFCLQKMFGMTALCIQCGECNTLDIVV